MEETEKIDATEVEEAKEVIAVKPVKAAAKSKEEPLSNHIYALRTTANREDQVMDFVHSNATKKKLEVYSLIRPHGLRGYIFIEAGSRVDAEQAVFRVPYARGIIASEIDYKEMDNFFEVAQKVDYDIRKNDIAEIIAGPFKREKCKITRVDKSKDEVVVELLEAAVPIPITLKTDSIKVIRREGEEDSSSNLNRHP
jgi:transcriptional antiterminator NusG